jgi:phosphomannomutase
MKVEVGLFKAYDIRGIAGQSLTGDLAEAIGRAFVAYLKPRRVAVGRDVRVSGPELSAALVRGITASGCDVVDIGVCTSDALYFAVAHFGFDGGAMVTASHNPPEWNGFKFARANAAPLHSNEGIEQIRDLVAAGGFVDASKPGTVTVRDVHAEYLAKVLSFGTLAQKRRLTVVVDPGNATAGAFLPALMKRLPFEMSGIHMELDGTFPGRNPNPLIAGAIDPLARTVRKRKADVGVAFDADADRMFLVDERGELVRGDMLLAILAKPFLAREPGAAIVYNLICSHATPEAIAAAGGRPIRSRVGHAYIKPAMRREDAILGGEVSAHFFFRDFWFADSGLSAMVAALNYLASQEQPLSSLVAGIAKYARGDEINTRVEDIPGTIERIAARFADGKQNREDGLTVEYPDWWFNVRPSNTEPLLRLTVEAANTAELKRRQGEVLAFISAR